MLLHTTVGIQINLHLIYYVYVHDWCSLCLLVPIIFMLILNFFILAINLRQIRHMGYEIISLRTILKLILLYIHYPITILYISKIVKCNTLFFFNHAWRYKVPFRNVRKTKITIVQNFSATNVVNGWVFFLF